jgi:hypothetical protein
VLDGLDVRLPRSDHESQPWRIHEIAHDFKVEDVWALPTPGGPDDFPRLVRLLADLDPAQASSPVVRMLFEIRSKLGDLLGLDDPVAGLGSRVPTLRERLPADLRIAPAPRAGAMPFVPLYETRTEYAAETANRTVHGLVHLGWVADDEGGYRGQLAILVKRNGLLGAAYMAAIAPFRYLVVYPQILRELGRTWRAEVSNRPA